MNGKVDDPFGQPDRVGFVSQGFHHGVIQAYKPETCVIQTEVQLFAAETVQKHRIGLGSAVTGGFSYQRELFGMIPEQTFPEGGISFPDNGDRFQIIIKGGMTGGMTGT